MLWIFCPISGLWKTLLHTWTEKCLSQNSSIFHFVACKFSVLLRYSFSILKWLKDFFPLFSFNFSTASLLAFYYDLDGVWQKEWGRGWIQFFLCGNPAVDTVLSPPSGKALYYETEHVLNTDCNLFLPLREGKKAYLPLLTAGEKPAELVIRLQMPDVSLESLPILPSTTSWDVRGTGHQQAPALLPRKVLQLPWLSRRKQIHPLGFVLTLTLLSSPFTGVLHLASTAPKEVPQERRQGPRPRHWAMSVEVHNGGTRLQPLPAACRQVWPQRLMQSTFPKRRVKPDPN